MIYYVNGGTLHGGMSRDGRQMAEEVTKYLNEHYPDKHLELLYSITGKDTGVAWLSKHESMAAMREYQKAFNADEGLWAIINKWWDKANGKDYWVDGLTATYWEIQDV